MSKQKNLLNFVIFLSVLVISIFSVSAVDVSTCQGIPASGTYDLINDINTTTDNCLSVTSDNTIIDCHGYKIYSESNHNDAISFNSVSNVTLRNCELGDFSPTGRGIFLNDVSDALVENIVVDNTTTRFNIYSYLSDNVIIQNVTMVDVTQVGIYPYVSDEVTIKDSTFTGFTGGGSGWAVIQASNNNNITISNNNFYDNYFGIDITNTINTTGMIIDHNDFHRQTGSYMIKITGTSTAYWENLNISYNNFINMTEPPFQNIIAYHVGNPLPNRNIYIHDNYAFAPANTNTKPAFQIANDWYNANIYNNHVIGLKALGGYAEFGSDILNIYNNDFSGGGTTATLYSSISGVLNNTNYYNNRMYDGQNGMYIQGSNLDMYNNTCTNVTGDWCYALQNGNDGSIYDNTCDAVTYCARARLKTGGSIHDNIISNGYRGIELRDAFSVEVYDNIITNQTMSDIATSDTNSVGIRIRNTGSGHSIHDNIVTGSIAGMFFTSNSFDNLNIFENTFSGGIYGINFAGSTLTNLNVNNNNIFDNSIQVNSTSAINIVGNYYGDGNVTSAIGFCELAPFSENSVTDGTPYCCFDAWVGGCAFTPPAGLFSYTTDDISKSIISTLTKFIIALGLFLILIVGVLVFNFGKKKIK